MKGAQTSPAAIRVLLVEDGALAQSETAAHLARTGYEVVGFAGTADAAVELARAAQPDLVLVDIQLEGTAGGIEAAARIRRQLVLPVVLMAALPEAASLARALAEAPHAYVIKPFQDHTLRLALEIALLRHQAEQARLAAEHLHQTNAEARFDALLESSPDAMVVSDAGGTIVRTNARCERMFGYERGELQGQSIERLMPPRLLGAHRARFRDYPRQPKPRAMASSNDLNGARKDGSEFPVEISLSPMQTEQGLLIFGAIRDVTERHQAQQRLRHSEERFRSLTKLSADWFWEQDAEFRFVQMAGDLSANFFHNVPLEQHIGLKRWEIPTADVTPEQWKEHRALLEAHLPFRDFIKRRPDVDGRQRWASISGEPIFGPDGEFRGYHGVGRDITDQMLASKALQDSLASMQATLDATNDAIAVIAVDGTYLHYNQRYIDIWNLPQTTALHWRGIRAHVLAQLREPEVLLRREREMIADQTISTFDLVECVDGRYLEMLSRPMRSSQGLGGRVWSLRDVTAQQLATRGLAESEARLRLFIERAPAALAMLDRHLDYLRVSRRWQQEYAPDFPTLVGRNHLDVVPDTPQRWLDAFQRALQGEIVQQREDAWVRPDGSVQWQRWELAPWQHVDGSVGGFVIFAENITQEREAEAQIRALNANLERRVAERTAELAAARDRAQQFARAKSEFAAHMSHEIRTPLHAVIGVAGIGAREAREATSQRAFHRILEAGDHLLKVVNDILALSRQEAGKEQAVRQPLRLHDVVAKVDEVTLMAASTKGLACSCHIDDNVPDWVEGDAVKLQQVLVNLLSNGVKFTDHGAVRLEVSYAAGIASFVVRDTGMGIPPDQMHRLFQPFEQLDARNARRQSGTGLGLMLSQRLAALMGGTLSAESTPGRGSVFTLRVPLPAVSLPQDLHPPAEPAIPLLTGVRVLAADDLDINRQILDDLLRHAQALPVIVESGAEALAQLQQAGTDAFDIVLMDVQMAPMDGYETARRIVEMAPGLPVLGITAHALPEERQRCLDSGMVGHLAKPFGAEALAREIVAHLRRAPGDARPQERPATAVAPPFDLAALRRSYETTPGFADKLVQRVLDTRESLAARLEAATAAQDLKAIRHCAHDIAAIAAFLLAQPLLEAARHTESAPPEAAVASARALAQRLAQLMESLAPTGR